MSYGLKYFADYMRLDGSMTRLEIEEDNYTMYPIEVKCISINWTQGNGNAGLQNLIKGSKVNIGLATIKGLNGEGFDYDLDLSFENVVTEVDYREFYTQDETKFRVTVYREPGIIFFRGYILPDIFLDQYVDYERIIKFTASDRLNRLVDIDFTGNSFFITGDRSIANLLISARDSIKLEDLNIIGSTRLKETTGGAGVPTTSEIGVNSNFLIKRIGEGNVFTGSAAEPRNFEDILNGIAKTFFSNIFQWKGSIYFYSIINSFFTSADIAEYENDPTNPVVSTEATPLTNISGKMLAVPTIEGQPTARRSRVVYKIGDQRVNTLNDLVRNGEFDLWTNMYGTGIYRWKLVYWTYHNCNYSNQATRGDSGSATDDFVVMRRQWPRFDPEYIESTNNDLTVTPNHLLDFSLKFMGMRSKNSQKDYIDRRAYFVFQLIIVGDLETHYLKLNDTGAFEFTTVDTLIRIKFDPANYYAWSDFLADNLRPPVSGQIYVRLYNTQQLQDDDGGFWSRGMRFHSAYDDVNVLARANEAQEDRDKIYTIDTKQGYSSFSEDYEVILGDFDNSFSESALIIDGRPTVAWAYNSSGTGKEILLHVLDFYANNTTNPRLTINCRIQDPDLDITRGVLVDGIKYRINYVSLDDAKNIWTLELQQVYG